MEVPFKPKQYIFRTNYHVFSLNYLEMTLLDPGGKNNLTNMVLK